jgi:hypothetical protein
VDTNARNSVASSARRKILTKAGSQSVRVEVVTAASMGVSAFRDVTQLRRIIQQHFAAASDVHIASIFMVKE